VTSKSEESEWQRLSWAEKVQICQQGIAHEDSLLTTHVLIFIALEAMFFALVFSIELGLLFNIIITILAIYVAVLFIKISKKRGDYVDCWGAILYALWKELGEEDISRVKASEIAKHYEGCCDRRKRSSKEIIFGWGSCKEKLQYFFWETVRRFMTTFTPILVILAWIIIIAIKSWVTLNQ